MSTLKLFLFAFIGATLLPRIYVLLKFMDFGEDIFNHTPGKCHNVKGADTGSEDMELIPGTDIALISTGLKYGKLGFHSSIKDRQGNILYFDFTRPNEGAKPVKFNSFDDKFSKFNPHGISIFQKNDEIFLFVVNHPGNIDSCVERFQVDTKSKTLTFLETIAIDGFQYLNDLCAVDERSFYFTNYMYHAPGSLMGSIEIFAQFHWASLAFYNGEKAVTVQSSLMLPNGVNISPDGKFLYLVTIGDSENLHVFEMNEDYTLKPVQHKLIETNLDNIVVDSVTGDLWIGCHPVTWRITNYLENFSPNTKAPSQVLKVKTKNGLITDDVTEVFVDKGDLISASSVALYHKNAMLVGSICDKTVYCQM